LRNHTEDRDDQSGGRVVFEFGEMNFGAESFTNNEVMYDFNVKISPEGSSGLQLSKMLIAGIENPGSEIPQMYITFTNEDTRRAQASVILQSPAFSFSGGTIPDACDITETVKGTVYKNIKPSEYYWDNDERAGMKPGETHIVPTDFRGSDGTVYEVDDSQTIFATSVRVIVERDARPYKEREEKIFLNIFNFPEDHGGTILGILPGGGMDEYITLNPVPQISPQKGNTYREIIIKKPFGDKDFLEYSFLVFTTHKVKNVNEWLRMSNRAEDDDEESGD
ncbi:MAG: hypothetical protein FWF82_07440, partial [Oscillospiraceae bacterium]|nr:hypothetical protein [Oscillospiraceae bacterium]